MLLKRFPPQGQTSSTKEAKQEAQHSTTIQESGSLLASEVVEDLQHHDEPTGLTEEVGLDLFGID